MKTTELMIGDWVFYNNKIIKVDNIYDECINYTPDIPYVQEEYFIEESDLQPIPLTKEIIKKNGFSKIGTIGDSYIHCIANDSCYYEIEINLHDNTLCVNKTWLVANNIRYVHELQHALRMCGIEKEIEL